jgi:arylsulfatase A-like enzyme
VTGIFGKWHLGATPNLLPLAQGFDAYAGVPYSHDMWPRHPENPKAYIDLPLYEGTKVVAINPEPDTLTAFYHKHAIEFIEKNKDRPFFCYIPHSLPHVPLGAGENFKGKSGHGLYGDVISEIDWCVGDVMATLKRLGLDEKTLVIFTSDNGPWTTYGDHAGNAGPLREAKGTSFEGGVRVPFVARWPGKIPAGATCKEPVMTIDILPTLAKLLNTELPKDRVIDGKDIWPLLSGQAGAKSPHEALYFYWDQHLQAVRSGKWKLHFPHEYRMAPEQRASGGKPNKARQGKIELSLFDLENDIGETANVAEIHPEIVNRLSELAETMRGDLGDSATKQKGTGRREAGKAIP